jgi:hypothetical protein
MLFDSNGGGMSTASYLKSSDFSLPQKVFDAPLMKVKVLRFKQCVVFFRL